MEVKFRMKVVHAVLSLLSAPLRGAVSAALPKSKVIVWGMDRNIHHHTKSSDWRDWSKVMAPYWSEDFVYDFIYPFNKTHGLHEWFNGEHSRFNDAFPTCNWTDMIFAGSESAATFCSYGIARWTGPFAGVAPPSGSPVVHIRDLDFYAFREGKISYNWCMVDVVDIFQQVGYQLLPPAPLPDDGYNPPRAMDGIPAPNSAFVDPSAARRAELPFRQMIQEDLIGQSSATRWWAEDMVWYGPAGIGTARSRAQYLKHFLNPFHASFSNSELELDSFLCEGTYCGAHFYIMASHTGTWLGLPATGSRLRIRFGIHARIRLDAHVEDCGSCGQIVDGWAQIDIPAAFAQMGVDLFARAQSNKPGGRARLSEESLDSKQPSSIQPVSVPAFVFFLFYAVWLCLLVAFLALRRRPGALNATTADLRTNLMS